MARLAGIVAQTVLGLQREYDKHAGTNGFYFQKKR
jgi:hypothetical protein